MSRVWRARRSTSGYGRLSVPVLQRIVRRRPRARGAACASPGAEIRIAESPSRARVGDASAYASPALGKQRRQWRQDRARHRRARRSRRGGRSRPRPPRHVLRLDGEDSARLWRQREVRPRPCHRPFRERGGHRCARQLCDHVQGVQARCADGRPRTRQRDDLPRSRFRDRTGVRRRARQRLRHGRSHEDDGRQEGAAQFGRARDEAHVVAERAHRLWPWPRRRARRRSHQGRRRTGARPFGELHLEAPPLHHRRADRRRHGRQRRSPTRRLQGSRRKRNLRARERDDRARPWLVHRKETLRRSRGQRANIHVHFGTKVEGSTTTDGNATIEEE